MTSPRSDTLAGDCRGFTYIEVLIAGSLLAFTLLAVCGMFASGYSQLTTGGRTTMGVAAGRQILEDMRRLPYDSLINLDGLDTDDATTLPESGPEREVARRWRYALAGEGVGWEFEAEELARWRHLSTQGRDLEALGKVSVVQASATLTEITVEIDVPGRFRGITLRTALARMDY